MASTSDGAKKKKSIRYSRMKQPPLIKQLKGILSEYPDGGQILKELIQNAEDAGAREVKILFDSRRMNDNSSRDDVSGITPVYTKFFKGPALCVYNDAVFTDDDWEGIQMIYSSVKEEDPMKVGRFGLGFKSVFHITDFPCVISGDRVLLIDPQQPTEKVNATLDLCALEEYTDEGMDADAFWRALDNTFDLNRNNLDEDGFNGTLFWFPLREEISELSETLYNETKVKDLFDSFQSEASNILLFLKNIEKISLHIRDMDAVIKQVICVELGDDDGTVRQKRSEFKKSIASVNPDINEEDIHFSVRVVINTSSANTRKSQEWLIVNYFVGKSASSDFKKLIRNKSLGYSPYVGVAAPVSGSLEDFEGHVFCFLPLPREGERLTGLPVHVNGFFALSQNRHHMKWETEEQEGKQIDDKSILWNKALIEEALPKAYRLLVLEAIKHAEKNSNEETAVSAVYNMMPLSEKSSSKLHKRWAILVNKVYETLEVSRLLYSSHLCEWIPIHETCFATFRGSSGCSIEIQEAVIRCLHAIGLKYANVPSTLFETIQIYFQNIEDITPLSMATYLHERDEYRDMLCEDKHRVLEYVLSDGENLGNVSGLELLPLASGQFEAFHRSSNAVYMCSDAAVKMFPGLESRLVMEKTKLGRNLTESIESICESGIYQIQKLNDDCAKNLLTQTITRHLGSDSTFQLTRETNLTIDWLRNVWYVLVDKKMIKHFKDIPLVPVLLLGSWPDPETVELVKLTEFIVVRETQDSNLSEGLCTGLETMTVKILTALPEWIPFEFIQEFVYRPTKEGITMLLVDVFKKYGNVAVSSFNSASQSNSEIAESLLQFVANLAHIEKDAAELLKKLRLFKAVSSMDDSGHYTAVFNTPHYILEDIDFPNGVQFPFNCIRVETTKDVVMRQLNAENVSTASLVLKIVQKLVQSQNRDQTLILMTYLIKNPTLVDGNTDICTYASQLAFLKAGNEWHKPSELFDPTSSSLQNLLLGESLFPENTCKYKKDEIRVLKKFGLKGKDKVDASVMLQVANRLNSWALDNRNSTDLLRKATEFMDVLFQNPHILDKTFNGRNTLGNAILNLACIPVKNIAPPDYPDGLPWFSETVKVCKPAEAKVSDLSFLAGATMPMIDCVSSTLIGKFKWDLAPEMNTVLQQMSFIRRYYNVNYKPDFTRAVQRIYKYMNQCKHDVPDIKGMLKNEKLVWVGSSFEIPEKVIISHRKQDLDLTPYYYYLPEEFRDMEDLFLYLGCHHEQNNRILLRVLENIKTKHISSEDGSILSMPRDVEIVLEALNVLAVNRNVGMLDNDSEILMLIEHDSTERLCLQRVSDCIFEDDQDELDPDEENSYYIVNSRVPVSVAKDLGVKSVKRKTILGATEELNLEDWGQSESLTTRISTLLRDGYKDGLSVPKELVQNADDAGATVVKFLYDERVNDDARRREKLLSGDLVECQGSALWVYNDSLFTEKDLVNITKLNGATKADFQDKIGKFGLGFCSVYNLTDVPSFVTGKDMVIFDPHETYLEDARQQRGKGLRIRLSKRHLIRRNLDQFKPYNAVFGCDLLETSFTSYNGTLFRLPLRTKLQAEKSEISKEAYTKEEVSALVNKLIENAGNIMLFTQSVMTMQIYHLSKHESDPSRAKLIFSVKKHTESLTDNNITGNAQGVLKRMPIILKRGQQFAEVHKVEISEEMFDSPFTETKSKKTYPHQIKSRWLVSWSLGIKESLKLSRTISDKGAVPLSSIAIPVTEEDGVTPLPIKESPYGFYTEGHLFCFLPLPVKTDLLFHINGCFSVTSDRRGLVGFTEDDKRKGDNCMWNQALMEDSLVRGYVDLLLFLSKVCSDKYNYSSLWPLKCTHDVQFFKQSFYRILLYDKPRLFRGVQEWLSVNEIMFLDPPVRYNKSIGDTAFELLSYVPARPGKRIVEISREVLKALKESKVDSRSIFKEAMISEEELIIHFLDTISHSFWDTQVDKRNQFILYALKLNSKNICVKLQQTACIPSEPDNILRRPNELINPKSEIADMFDVVDSKFPNKSGGFCENTVLAQLVSLGMNDRFLPKDMLIERCKSVEDKIKVCGCCAKERCVKILKYCGKWEVLQKLEMDSDTLLKVRSNIILPVLPRPKLWAFSWKADTSQEMISTSKCTVHIENKEAATQFEKPVNLYREALYSCSGSVCRFVNEKYLQQKCPLHEGLFSTLGIKCELTVELLSVQLISLSEQYTNSEVQFSSLEIITRSVYEYLARLTNDKSEEEISRLPWFLNMREKPTILIGRDLVMPSNVAFNVKEECQPELYRLREVDYNRKKMFRALGVADHFSVTVLVTILGRMYAKWFQRKCTDIDTIACLLRLLCDSMCTENITFDSLKASDIDIVAPDEDGYLRPTSELVIEDPAYKSSATLHILHGKISPDTGRALGVKSKQRGIVECFSTAIFMPFGQNESLVTRLTGILEDYPCDSSIMKELIQNADDAGATEIHFIKNYMIHPSAKVFGKKEMQGPSLCIFNDSYFTEEDFKGIKKLGIGSKREDPSKTGQYGIGFNAVYHLTDVPSFLTKGPGLGKCGQLCIFDPLMTYLKYHVTKENPGIKCDAELVEESFPDMLLGYPVISSKTSSEQGTVFRLPLRQKRSDISSNVVSVDRMDELIEEFKLDMYECLLFLKSVKCIKVLRNTKEGLLEEFVVNTMLSPEDTLLRDRYYSDVKEVVRANIETRHHNLCMQPVECSYTVNTVDSQGRNERWLIVNRFGFEHLDDIDDNLLCAIKEKIIGLMPVASVALPWPKDNWKESLKHKAERRVGIKHRHIAKKAFCFLPLPVETGLPLHVNGHFALDKSRTKLWDEGIRKHWNDFVLEELISRAWISAIQCMKKKFVDNCLPEMSKESVCSAVLNMYHEQFPLWDMATERFWKSLVSSFYRIVIGDNAEIFPCVQTAGTSDSSTQVNENAKLLIEWVALSKSETDFGGIFNVIPTMVSSRSENIDWTDVRSLERTLKKLRMKIIETPLSVSHSIRHADVGFVPTSSPELVIDFLKTFHDPTGGNCQLGGIDIPLTETAIYETAALKSILKYTMIDEMFTEKVEGLPLCLTNDGFLHIFSRNTPMYNSHMCEVLTGSANQFIHSDVVCLVHGHKFHKAGVIKRFAVDDLLSVIAETFDPSILANGNHVLWNKQLGVPVKPEVIFNIFDFFYNESLEVSSSYLCRSTLNHKHFQTNVRKLDTWSLMPSCINYGSEKTYELVPVRKTSHLFHKSGAGHHTLCQVILKFNIPVLDTSVFLEHGKNLIYPLQKLLPSTELPIELLKCLLHYKGRIQSCNLTCDESIVVLSYFDDKIDQMKEQMNVDSLEQKLKRLPLYVSYQKTVTSIEQYSDVIVLPCGMPLAGLDTWAQQTGILLLKDTDRLLNLYGFLQLSRMSELDIYVNKLLQSIHHLPRNAWEIHVKYIKDRLLVTSYCQQLDVTQRRLVEQMKQLAFVRVAGKDRKACELYDHNNPVFVCMLTEDSFLPAVYRDYSWISFMRVLGLKMHPTGEMLIDFALELEAKINSPISDLTKKQSSALIDCLYDGMYNDRFSEQILQRISRIRFVVPYIVNTEKQQVAAQPGEGKVLICLSSAVPNSNEDYCWSSLNLLSYVPMSNEMLQSLGICRCPPVDKIVQHCQHVSDIVKVQLEKRLVRPSFVKNLMEKLYKKLLSNFNPSMKQKFQVSPIIFQPDDAKMLPIKQIVINLTEDEEVRPYLYKLPNCYGAYVNLFTNLGSEKSALCSHYSMVLEAIKQQFGNGPVPANKLLCVKKALENIVRLLDKEREPLQNVKKLYIPDRNQVLRCSKTLTVSNNVDIEERLEGKIEIDFFLGFKEIEIKCVSDPALPFQMCPDNLRPDILTDVVMEQISTADIERQECVKSLRLESRLRSPCFVESILRLVKHQMKLSRKYFEKSIERKFMLCLTNICVTKVSGLKTFLTYKNSKVNGTDRDATCFIKSGIHDQFNGGEVIEHELYFQIDDDDEFLINLIEDPQGLVKLIDICTDGILEKDLAQHLPMVLRLLEQPQKIKKKLDMLKIAAYDLPATFAVSVFPRPGTYVEEKFHPFLEQSISPFMAHEFMYVALEVEDANDANEPVYIYAHIIGENRRRQGDSVLDITYKVDVGSRSDELIDVPIYRLYRFKPRETVEENALVVYDIEPIGSIPIDENFRRVRSMLLDAWEMDETERNRIIRRLLTRWHPDRNKDHREYSQRLFYYVQETVIRLENNEVVDNIITNETGRMPPDMSRSSFGSASHVYNRGCRYARAYYDNMYAYNRTTRTGHFAHHRAEEAVVRHVGEAKRWYRQAVQDFKAAKSNLSTSDNDKSFNWVCFKCHQASEKALKAAWFSKNANRATRRDHSLTAVAYGLDDGSFLNEARILENITGEYSLMRYPDAVVGRHKIPSEMFDSTKAEQAIEVTKRILDIAEEFIG